MEGMHIHGDIGYLPESQATIKFNAFDKKNNGSKPTAPVETDLTRIRDWELWGEDDDWPQQVYAKLKKNTIVSQAIPFLASIKYGTGLAYYFKEQPDENGNPTKNFRNEPKIDEWLRANCTARYLREMLISFETFFNPFNELILSKDRKQITNLINLKPRFCRWGRKENGMLYSKDLFINGDFGETFVNLKQSTRVPVINPEWYPVEQVMESGQYKFSYPIKYPDPFNEYYSAAPFHSIIESGWLDVANSIPSFKKHLFQNQIAIKYHIIINPEYYKYRFKTDEKEWDDFTDSEKLDKMGAVKKEIEDFLTGEKNAGKAWFTHKFYDHAKNENVDAFEIQTIDNKIKDGVYIEDSQEASAHILAAMGIPLALFGNIPSRDKMGAGSGSDIREAYNMHRLKLNMALDMLLEPFQFIARYNGWPSNIKFVLPGQLLSTEDRTRKTRSTEANGADN